MRLGTIIAKKGIQFSYTVQVNHKMGMSATYRPKNTVEHRVIDFVHTLCVFLGLL